MFDEEEANCFRKLKTGHGKYKGMLPFKCFKCGRIKHFASKCMFEERKYNESEEELDYQEQRNKYQQRGVGTRRIFLNKQRVFTPRKIVFHMR